MDELLSYGLLTFATLALPALGLCLAIKVTKYSCYQGHKIFQSHLRGHYNRRGFSHFAMQPYFRFPYGYFIDNRHDIYGRTRRFSP